MDDVRIALDLEGVLAHPHGMVLDHTDRFTEEDLQTFGFEQDELDHFLDVTEDLWENYTLDIPVTEDDIGRKVERLRSHGTVDLVTNTPAAPQDVYRWMDHHGIEVDEYVFPGPGFHKHELDYDIYIDDNPYMPGDPGIKILYFYTQPYNEEFGRNHFLDVDDPAKITYYDLTEDDPIVINSIHEDRQTVVRVDSMSQVHVDLAHRRVNGATAI